MWERQETHAKFWPGNWLENNHNEDQERDDGIKLSKGNKLWRLEVNETNSGLYFLDLK